MNSTSFDHRFSIPVSKSNMEKINPFNQNKNTFKKNKSSSKRKLCITNSNREFGKEINDSTNLTTYNNQEIFNNKKSLRIPINKKIKKDISIPNPDFKSQNYENNAAPKKKKIGINSLNKKPNNSLVKCLTHKNSREKINKNCLIVKSKKFIQKKILDSNSTVNIIGDIIKKDENTNPNIISKSLSSKMNNSFNTFNHMNKIDNVVEMEIENKEKKVKTKKSLQNVDEYFNDICDELFNYEGKYLVDPQYMSRQSDINHRMRAILIDWLIDVHLKYKLIPQTIYIAVNLIDRYLSKNDTNRAKLQLVGVTAMFIACKYEEIYPPKLKEFVYITDGAYVKSDVLNMEYKMLKSLDFSVTFPTQWSFFEIYKKKLNLNEKTIKLAWFLMELCLIDYKTLKFKMSILAASSILIATKTLGVYKSNWLGKIIGIDEKSLEECCKEIYEFYVYNSTHSLQAIRRKFSSSKYDEVSKIKLLQGKKIK